MKKFFDKDEVWFAVTWIIVYVLGFSLGDTISEKIGIPKLITLAVGLCLTVVLSAFVLKNRLSDYFGLKIFSGNWEKFLFFTPLMAISTVNLWGGLQMNGDLLTAVLSVMCMCFVAFLEELIFRGFLFKAMSQSNVTAAIIVSSVTFGVGHVVNLLMGAPVLDTLLQLVYASAVGFCFTMVFHRGGSIIPCIVTHAVVNALSVFGNEPSQAMKITTAVAMTVVALGYGFWLMKAIPAPDTAQPRR